MIGIYKITSPKKRVYIGQSINIEKRFYRYRKLECKAQVKLYNSFLKYGVENHIFEIICQCDIVELDQKEIFYIDLYNAVHFKNGLNCKGGGKSGVFSEETRKKMSESAKKRGSNRIDYTWSEESRLKMSKIMKGRTSPRKGAVLTLQQKEKLRSYQLGVKQSKKTKLKRILSSKGIVNCKKVKDEITGKEFNSAIEAAEFLGIKASTLRAKLSGQNKNNTNLKYK